MKKQMEHWSEGKNTKPAEALSVRFDGWGNVTEQKDWTVAWLNGGVYAAILSATRLYRYDALNRRSGEGNWDLFYDQAGNVIEERPSGAMAVQYVWSGVGGNHMVLRDRNTDGNMSTRYQDMVQLPPGIEERFYAITDVQGNVCAITDWAGTAIERYFYTPEGKMGITNGTASGTRQSTDHAWEYTYHSGRQDTAGVYYVNGKVIDYRSGGPITASPLAYWHRQMSYEPADLGWWDKTVMFVSPFVAAALATPTGPLGMYLAFTAMSSFVGGYNRYQDGQGLGGAIGGGIADGTGFSAVYVAACNHDIVTDQYLGLSNSQRYVLGVFGTLQLVAPILQIGGMGKALQEMGKFLGNRAGMLAAVEGGAWGGSRALAFAGSAAGGLGQAINSGGLWAIGALGNAAFSVTRDPRIREAFSGGVIRPTSDYRAGVSRTPRHHWLPQRDRAFFNARRISDAEIDRLTSPLSEGIHQAIEKYVGSMGGYRDTLIRRIMDKEAELGRILSRREVLRQVASLRREIGLQGAKTVPYGAP